MMVNRVLVIRLVLLGTLWFARNWPSVARAADDVTVLQPIRSFQVQGLDSFRLNDAAAYNGDLFLLLKDPSGPNEILRITGNGDILAKISLPSMQMYHQLRISASGTLAVSLPHNASKPPLTTISLHDTGGGLKTSFDIPLANEIAFMGEDLVGVGRNGVVRLTSGSQFMPNAGTLPIVLLDRGPVMTAALPQDRLAIVEILSARLQIAATNAVLAGPMVLYAPEIQGIQRPQFENASVAMVSTVASNPVGDLYLGISGGKRQEGAPVLQLDSTGTLRNRIKCILPTFGLDPSDFQSFMYPAKLVATNDSLFWISVSEKKFAVYSVASLH